MKLYHASSHKNLTMIEPKRTLSKDRYIGDYVFATSNLLYAVMNLSNKGLYKILGYQSNPPRIIVVSTPEEYMKNDKGGAIYELQGDDFFKSPQAELDDSEMVTDKAVMPLSETVYKTSIEAMERNGIEIYFVNKPTFDSIITNMNEDEVVKSLRPFDFSAYSR